VLTAGTFGPAARADPHGAVILSVSPTFADAGGPSFNVLVTGLGFFSGMVVRWNGTDRPTTFLNAEQLRVAISDKDISKGGNASLYVWDGDQPSNAWTFPVNNPAPAITGLKPSAADAGSAPITVMIEGTGFVPNSDVQWNGKSRDVDFQSSTSLRVQLESSDLAAPSTAAVRVVNSLPGGGASNFGSFTVNGRPATLYFPRLVTTDGDGGASDSSDYTGIAVVNLGNTRASLNLTAYDALGGRIEGASIANPRSLDLEIGQQMPIVDSQVFGAGLPARAPLGWIRADSTSDKVVGFFLMFNRTLSVLDGADVSSETLRTFIFPEIEAEDGVTRLHVANPNPEPTILTLDLVSGSGTVRASTPRTVPARGALIETIGQTFPAIRAGTDHYVRVTATDGVVPFEALGRPGRYLEGLNGQSSTAGAAMLYSPQYAVGGGTWRSTLSIVNLEDVGGTVTLRLVGDDGGQIGEQRRVEIPPRGKIRIEDQSFFAPAGPALIQGWVEIASSAPKLAGSVVFGDPARERFSSALPLTSRLVTDAVFGQVASDETYFTGIALLNPGNAAASAVLELHDAAGASLGRAPVALGARQRRSQLLTEYFPQFATRLQSSGYIKLTSDRPLAAFALFGTKDLSVLSAVPAQVAP
jgi:hypothetical protein